MQTEDCCPGSTDFRMVREKQGAFEGIDEDIIIVGFISCGGCPGKKAVLRAKELIKQGADAIAFASCIQKGTPIGYPCPFAKKMKECIVVAAGENIKIIDYTH
jgi:predicted metal-binding protein